MNTLERDIVAVIEASPIRNKIRSVALFGSQARGDARPDSDVDLLVDLTGPVGFPAIRLIEELEQRLGKKVEFLTPESVNRFMRDEIFRTKKTIYER